MKTRLLFTCATLLLLLGVGLLSTSCSKDNVQTRKIKGTWDMVKWETSWGETEHYIFGVTNDSERLIFSSKSLKWIIYSEGKTYESVYTYEIIDNKILVSGGATQWDIVKLTAKEMVWGSGGDLYYYEKQ